METTTQTTSLSLRVSRRFRIAASTWIAEIVGTDERYGLARDFYSVGDFAEIRWSKSGETGYATLDLSTLGAGVWEISCDGKTTIYTIDRDGQASEITAEQAAELVS